MEWMDVIASKLLNLEHLSIRTPSQKGLDDESSFWLRMRRLYVLHRLPCLETLKWNADHQRRTVFSESKYSQ
jgi:hypothetical protein